MRCTLLPVVRVSCRSPNSTSPTRTTCCGQVASILVRLHVRHARFPRDVLATPSRGCYEETAPVEFQLKATLGVVTEGPLIKFISSKLWQWYAVLAFVRCSCWTCEVERLSELGEYSRQSWLTPITQRVTAVSPAAAAAAAYIASSPCLVPLGYRAAMVLLYCLTSLGCRHARLPYSDPRFGTDWCSYKTDIIIIIITSHRGNGNRPLKASISEKYFSDNKCYEDESYWWIGGFQCHGELRYNQITPPGVTNVYLICF